MHNDAGKCLIVFIKAVKYCLGSLCHFTVFGKKSTKQNHFETRAFFFPTFQLIVSRGLVIILQSLPLKIAFLFYVFNSTLMTTVIIFS
jgi:hypothetical protein